MKEGPDISRIASLIGDPGRANMLVALMSGKALTATELTAEAGVTKQTASSHLSKLRDAGLIEAQSQGRHRYFRLSGDEVATALEALMGLAASKGNLRTRTGPKDGELRFARVCYKHLAGEQGVLLYDAMRRNGHVHLGPEGLNLTEAGADLIGSLGIKIAGSERSAMCLECLDWSVRRSHLAGRLGRAILQFTLDQKWAARVPDTRIIRFSARGGAEFSKAFQL